MGSRFNSALSKNIVELTTNRLTLYVVTPTDSSSYGFYSKRNVFYLLGAALAAPEPNSQDPTRVMRPRLINGITYNEQVPVVGQINTYYTAELTLPPNSLGAMPESIGRYLRNANSCRVDLFLSLECEDYEDRIAIHFPDALFYPVNLGELINIDDPSMVTQTSSVESPTILIQKGIVGQTKYKASIPVYGAFALVDDECGCERACKELVFLARDEEATTVLNGFYITDNALDSSPSFVNLLSSINSAYITDVYPESSLIYLASTTASAGAIPYPPVAAAGALHAYALNGGTVSPITLPEGASSSVVKIFRLRNGRYVTVGHAVSATNAGFPSVYSGENLNSLSVLNTQDLGVTGEDFVVHDAAYDASTDTIYVVGRTGTTNASRLIAIKNSAVVDISSQVPTLNSGEYLTSVAVVGDDMVMLGTNQSRILEGGDISYGNSFYLLSVTLKANDPVVAIRGENHRVLVATRTALFERSFVSSPVLDFMQHTFLPTFSSLSAYYMPTSLMLCNDGRNEFDGANNFWLANLDGSVVQIANF